MSQDNKFDLVKTELELCQKQMDKYDDLSAKIKTWVVTLWAALSGWAFQSGKKEILYLSIFIILVFWVLDAVNKNFREDYKKRRQTVADALKSFFQGAVWPEGFFGPSLPHHHFRGVLTNFIKAHIFLLYLSLIIVDLIVLLMI